MRGLSLIHTPRSVCLLRSRRRTFFFFDIYNLFFHLILVELHSSLLLLLLWHFVNRPSQPSNILAYWGSPSILLNHALVLGNYRFMHLLICKTEGKFHLHNWEFLKNNLIISNRPIHTQIYIAKVGHNFAEQTNVGISSSPKCYI